MSAQKNQQGYSKSKKASITKDQNDSGFLIVSPMKELSPIKEKISEEQKCIEVVEFGWQRHKLGGEIRYLEQFYIENPNLQKSDIQRLDLDSCLDEQGKPVYRKTTQALMQNMALKIQSRISMAGEQIYSSIPLQQACLSDYHCFKGDYGKDWKGHQVIKSKTLSGTKRGQTSSKKIIQQ
ncbi:unnamed protein product (macronuclear) [Paramecium tetraurelia]|uniref:Uncharacterized protein n=1 Tax=Paramecium tetraurelia TaxID=5888 RepID=A0D3V0_PARTE|nr:uncharacterized protein GSPATT00013182001 [Paramecium tetraurelia]CAK77717.1 unnamed protein product [Paramecium tetraurelia]|eukprot:XP_001445114.1 hypothetical protein (macronuclear) [Paramecium tetraurelia strain d4-2]